MCHWVVCECVSVCSVVRVWVPYQPHGSFLSPELDAYQLPSRPDLAPGQPQILTSEFAVPSQAWHVNPAVDKVIVKLVTDLLLALGGSSSMSKLRHTLKDSLRSEYSIKSVPLKNFIKAYSKHCKCRVPQHNHSPIVRRHTSALFSVFCSLHI